MMNTFGNERKRFSWTEAYLLSVAGFLLWKLLGSTEAEWEAFLQPAAALPVSVLLQTALAGLLALTAAFSALLYSLGSRSAGTLRPGGAAGALTGFFLLALEQCGRLAGAPEDRSFTACAALILIFGVMSAVRPAAELLYAQKKMPRKEKGRHLAILGGTSAVGLLPCCCLSWIFAGLILPFAAGLVWAALFTARTEAAEAERARQEALAGLTPAAHARQTLLFEAEQPAAASENVLSGSNQAIQASQTRAVLYGRNPAELPAEASAAEGSTSEKTPSAVSSVTEQSVSEKKQPAVSSAMEQGLSAESRSGTSSAAGTAAAGKTEKRAGGGAASWAAGMPQQFLQFFTHDRKTGTVFRLDPETGEEFCLGEGTEASLEALLPEGEITRVRKFFLQSGPRQLLTQLWSPGAAEYRETILTASGADPKTGRERILAADCTAAGSRTREQEEQAEKKIQALEQKIGLLEEEEHRAFLATNEMLSDIIERKSRESRAHLQRVGAYTRILLEQLRKQNPEKGPTEQETAEISEAALLYDIGKLEIPDSILNKQARLTPEEYEQMKLHTVLGARLINRMPYGGKYESVMKYALELALHHHERYDGKGYPDGLSGEQIPYFVQIVSLADSYAALTSDRTYRKGISHEDACRMIQEGQCGAFSPEMCTLLEAAGAELADARYRFDTGVE